MVGSLHLSWRKIFQIWSSSETHFCVDGQSRIGTAKCHEADDNGTYRNCW